MKLPSATWCAFFVTVVSACDARQNLANPEWTLSRMLEQPRYSTFGQSSFFRNGMAMRAPVVGTVARDTPLSSELVTSGSNSDGALTGLPVSITMDLLHTGRAKFNTVCAACHGVRGDGASVVARKMQQHPPPSLLGADIATFSPGRIFHAISDGYGLMMPMRTLLSTEDRWAVVAYVQALQLSQASPVEALPDDVRAELGRGSP